MDTDDLIEKEIIACMLKILSDYYKMDEESLKYFPINQLSHELYEKLKLKLEIKIKA